MMADAATKHSAFEMRHVRSSIPWPVTAIVSMSLVRIAPVHNSKKNKKKISCACLANLPRFTSAYEIGRMVFRDVGDLTSIRRVRRMLCSSGGVRVCSCCRRIRCSATCYRSLYVADALTEFFFFIECKGWPINHRVSGRGRSGGRASESKDALIIENVGRSGGE